MAFDSVRVRKVRKDDEDSFLDWDGKATLFDEDGDGEAEIEEVEDPELDAGDEPLEVEDEAEGDAGDEEPETDEDL